MSARDAVDPAPTPVPLARLLAMAYRQLIDGLHDRLREAGWHDVRPVYGFVLLAARQGPLTASEVGVLMGTTKQAASKLVDAMEQAGYLRRRPSADDARQKVLELNRRGRDLLAAVEGIYAELEAEWAEVVGAAAVERLRRDLTRVLVAGHDGELPPVRPLW